MKVTGKVTPLGDKILVSHMDFGMEKTASGIYVPSDDGKTQGIRPRWGRVWAVGPDQQDVQVGEWILIEHGRWTRKYEIEQEDGSILKVHGVDNNCILMAADEKPSDVVRAD
jgi:co-chaperonin GroES (HSP10)